MFDQEKPWATAKLNEVNKLLEAFSIGELRLVTKNGVRFAVTPNVPENVTDSLSQLFAGKPKGPNNCYGIAEYVMDKAPAFDTIMSDEKGRIVNGDHCINFGQRMLVDMSIESYFGSMFDVLLISLPSVLASNVDAYTALATKIYGGDWKYFGKEGHERSRKIVEEAKKARERVR